MKTQIARKLVWAALALVMFFLSFALFNMSDALLLVQKYDSQFKLIGLGIGPILALLGFFWGLIDKAEMKDLSEELGKAKEAAQNEKTWADEVRSEAALKIARIKSLEEDIAAIADSSRLGKLRVNRPFPEYKGWKHDPQGAVIVSIALFKGGVGKTHLAANFAAYVSEKQNKPVLLVYLDYQGSLSTSVLTAAGLEPIGSQVDALFNEHASLATLTANRTHLANKSSGVALNSGKGLSRAWLVGADYTLSEVESQLLVSRVINGESPLDERYRLAHVLLDPAVRREFSMIIIDTPPRMTLGAVNAFVASHCYLVPTILDKVSSEAVTPFLEQVSLLKSDLDLDLRLAGLVGTMTRNQVPSERELKFFDEITSVAEAAEGTTRECFARGTLPRKVQVTNQDDLGYFLSDSNGSLAEQFYDPLFDKLWTQIKTRPETV
jgi:chromosome partitioning protein